MYSEVDLLLRRPGNAMCTWCGYGSGPEERQPALHARVEKLGPKRYCHVMKKEGEYVDSPSPFATATLDEGQESICDSVKEPACLRGLIAGGFQTCWTSRSQLI
jgi:hypothetical protein